MASFHDSPPRSREPGRGPEAASGDGAPESPTRAERGPRPGRASRRLSPGLVPIEQIHQLEREMALED